MVSRNEPNEQIYDKKAKQLIQWGKNATESQIVNQSKTKSKVFYSYIRQKKVFISTNGPLIDEKGVFSTWKSE